MRSARQRRPPQHGDPLCGAFKEGRDLDILATACGGTGFQRAPEGTSTFEDSRVTRLNGST